jgi:uncharacterized protein YukE
MTGAFRADPAQLADQAGQFAELADRAAAIHRELADALAEVGSCWGTDTVGRGFAEVHAGPADATLGQLGALPARLGSVGTRFADTAAAYRQQDSVGARLMNRAAMDPSDTP